jgi:hypothetical protein
VSKKEVEVFDDATAFRAAQRGARGGKARPKLPRAPRAESIGLGALIEAGWSWSHIVGKGFRLDNPDGRTSGWQSSEKAACVAARKVKEQ